MEEFFPGLDLLKGWDDVYDKSPLTHTGNWPLLGSKKPAEGSLPYEIKYLLDWDRETGETSMDADVPTSIIPELGKISVNVGEVTRKLTGQKCVRGKTIKYVYKGTKCPKGFVKKK
jgi:hypothetical protein